MTQSFAFLRVVQMMLRFVVIRAHREPSYIHSPKSRLRFQPSKQSRSRLSKRFHKFRFPFVIICHCNDNDRGARQGVVRE